MFSSSPGEPGTKHATIGQPARLLSGALLNPGAKALARLSKVTIFELCEEWRRLHRFPPPMRLSRDLLTRGITYKLQERAYGGLSKAVARKLEQTIPDPLSWGVAKPAPPIR